MVLSRTVSFAVAAMYFIMFLFVYPSHASNLFTWGSASDQLTERAQQDFDNNRYESAFDNCRQALEKDLGNKSAIRLFPDSFKSVYKQHFDNIEKLQRDSDYDNLAKEYDRIAEINKITEALASSVKEHYAKKQGFFAGLFSPSKQDIERVLTLQIVDVTRQQNEASLRAAETHHNAGKSYESNGDYRKAVEEYLKSKEFIANYKDADLLVQENTKMANEKDALINYEKGAASAKAENYREASELFKTAVSFVPNYKDAQALSEKYLQLANEKDALVNYEKGTASAKAENYREASEFFKTAVSFVSSYKDALVLSGKYLRLANEKDALVNYEKGTASAKAENYREASEFFKTAVSFAPNYKDAQTLSEKYHRMANEKEIPELMSQAAMDINDKNIRIAMNKFNKIIEIDPNYAEAYFERGNLYCMYLNECSVAINDYTKSISLNFKKGQSFSNRGVANLILGQYSNAKEDFDNSIILEPNNSKHYSNRSGYYIKCKDYRMAIQDATKAISLDSTNKDAYFNVASSCAGLGDVPNTIKYLEKACELGHENSCRLLRERFGR